MRVVAYHYVRDVAPGVKPQLKAVGRQAFREQVRYLKRTGRIITAAELIDIIGRDAETGKNDTLLTFDDGYLDHWENVLPILEQEQVTGLFFVSTRAVWERKITETNKIQLVLGQGIETHKIIAALDELVDERRSKYELLDKNVYWHKFAQAGRFDNADVKYIKNMLQFALPEQVRGEIVDLIFEQYVGQSEREVADRLYMTPKQVKELGEAGMAVGNHGYNHRWLDKLRVEQQRREIEHAQQQLVQVGVSKTCWTMCYPYGAYNQDTITLLKAMGCAAAFTTKGGEAMNSLAATRYEINRLDTNEIWQEMKMAPPVAARQF